MIQPQLPEQPWPMTDGGPPVQAAAEQTETLLHPFMDALLTDPRRHLPGQNAARHTEQMTCNPGESN